jgi:membrane-bound metal-dependent hydrolase YbcI (DUF457 family)
VTIYEHVMLGVDGALAANLHRRYGWRIVAWAGIAAALPDWDGLTLAVSIRYYEAGHRVWGHNLLVAGLIGVVLGGIAFVQVRFGQAGRSVGGNVMERTPGDLPNGANPDAAPILVWCLVGILASYSHLAMDLLYSYGHDLPVWEVPLLWPFSTRSWAFPRVPWGDVGTTMLFATGMLAMAKYGSRIRSIALATLGSVAGYVLIRGFLV